MLIVIRRFAWCLSILAVLQAKQLCLNAGEPPPSNLTLRSTVEELIGQLKSPNSPANPKGEPVVGFPRGYDFKKQGKVTEAERKLIALGKTAFPVLIEHLNDAEYSKSFYTAILRDFTVGEVCAMIISRQVEPDRSGYKTRVGSDGTHHMMRNFLDTFYRSKQTRREQFARWLTDRGSRTLEELQIEALRWTIEEETRIGFPEARDRELYLDPLVRKLAELKKETGDQ
jgi:hypothetical protein